VTLVAEDASKRYGDVTALDHVSLAVDDGECVALVGESGSGKTTLLRSFNRMVDLDGGRIVIDGRPVTAWDPVVLRRRMGYVPQDGGLLPHWRVRRNVGLVPWLLHDHDPDARANAALLLVGLDPETFDARWPRALSGGQRQRVAMARALAAKPTVMLLDEPFGALDAITRADLQSAFARLRQELRVTCVLVTHDLREAITLADRIAVLRRGRVEQVADAATLLATPSTQYVAELLERAGVRNTPLAS
jgi:osmoprotectant transport system ATP-binding protein